MPLFSFSLMDGFIRAVLKYDEHLGYQLESSFENGQES